MTDENEFQNGFQREHFRRFDEAGEDAVALDLERGALVGVAAGLAATWLGKKRKERAELDAARVKETINLARRAARAAEISAFASAVAAIAAAVAAAWPYIATVWKLPGAPK